MVNIFLDDLRKCPEDYLVFRTAESLILFLQHNPETEINILSLDHDLGLEALDGYDFVKEIYLQFPDIKIKEVRLHTDNFTGFRNMYYYFINAIKNEALPNIEYVSPYLYDVIDGEIKKGIRFTN